MLYGNINKKRGSSLYGDPIKELLTSPTIPGNEAWQSNPAMNKLSFSDTTPDYSGGAYMQNPVATGSSSPYPAMDNTFANKDTQIGGLAPSSLNNSFSNQAIPEKPGAGYGFDDVAGDGEALGLVGKMPNYNAIAYASMLPALGQSIKDITAAADRTPLTLANFNKAGSRYDKMSANLTQAKQDTLASSKSQEFQINQSSTGGLRNARLQGANSSYRDALGRVAANEQQLRNQVLQTQGQAEAGFAVDEANRKTQNITFNEQNKAATEDIRRQASQSIFNLVGENANNRQMFEDIKTNNLQLSQAANAEGFKFLNTMASNFGMDGSEELKAWQENPEDPAAYKAFMDAFQIKFKEFAPDAEPTK